jgi:hypothetical protein
VLRQLARLTRSIPSAGPGALTIAVYADGNDETVAARESGFEGVACVDDAARLLGLLCRVWERTHSKEIEAWVRGVLEFVLWMQEPDGRWVNFVYDWEGRRNDAGLTSSVGQNFWHARALCGLSRAWLAFGDERAERAMQRGLEHVLSTQAPPDVRALHMEVAMRLIERAGRSDLSSAVRHWAGEIAARQEGGIFMNNPDERGTPHLWAHVQEGVLADAGALLKEPALVETAVRSASTFLVPIVQERFDLVAVTPYDVSSAVFDLDRLGIATGDGRWVAHAADARAWFDGRNPAEAPVYDRGRGRVADGIDEGRVSENSGAEANIEAASALLDAAIESAPFATGLLPGR